MAAEALEQARAITGSAAPAKVQRLILAGHSRAYGFFDALAHEHASPHMRTGALSRPTHVWALDTTYSAPIADWRAWLRSREDLHATVVFRHGKYQTKGSTVVRELATGVRGREFTRLAAASNGRLTVMPVAAGKVSHCAIPAAYLPRLLAALPAVTTAKTKAKHWTSSSRKARPRPGRPPKPKPKAPEEETRRRMDRAGRRGEARARRVEACGDERETEWGAEVERRGTQAQEAIGALTQNEQTRVRPIEGEGPLTGSGLSTAEQKAVEITSLFETGKRGGFYGLSGNFDGQGLSFGLVNWTIGTGSLQPLLRDFAREQPARWAQVFGRNAPAFLMVIEPKSKAATKVQLKFAREQMNTQTIVKGKTRWSIKEPWVTYFKRLSEDREFQQIQVRYVRNLLKRADYFCQYFKLKSEMAFATCSTPCRATASGG